MNSIIELVIGIVLSLSLVLAYIEIMQVYEKQYVSECCQYSYRTITTTDKYNKSKTKDYCLNCRKWCEISEIKNDNKLVRKESK